MSTLLTLQVGAGNDDAHESTFTGFDATADSVRMDGASAASDRWNGGFRFQSVSVAQGANILKAWFIPSVATPAADDPWITISAEDVDNAVDFATDPDVTTRLASKTAATVDWQDTGIGIGFLASPNIAAVIQEIVDRGSWNSGNALVILAEGVEVSPTKSFAADAYDFANAAKLSIKYGTAVAVPHTLRHKRQRQNPTFAPFL